MKIEIKHRRSGAVLFEGEFGSLRLAVEAAVSAGADLSRADLYGADLSRADLSGADLSGADLREADLSRADLSGADLSVANLREADLSGANLRGADLRGADLSGADLRGADLSGANLRGADLREADLIDAGQDRRGYRFVAWLRDGVVWIEAGCRSLSLTEARAHWVAAHANDAALHAECLSKLDQIDAVATARGWIGKDQA